MTERLGLHTGMHMRPTESLDPSFFRPPASSRAPYAIAVDNGLSLCTYCSISDHWREFNITRTGLQFTLADHLGWTVHCVGILVHLTAGRGETFTHHTGETVTSPHHVMTNITRISMRCSCSKRSHVMTRVGSAERHYSACQAGIIHW